MKILAIALCFISVLFIPQCRADDSAKKNFERLKALAQESACRGYDEEFIDLIEMIYGKGFLSQGSKQSIDKMISGLDLNDCKILDLGSGLGAPALYLAEKYKASITGADPQAWMVERAKTNLKGVQKKLKGKVDFVVLKNASHLKQFPDDSFDVVFSKESLLHVPLELKDAFFKEIFRVLKPGGSIVILDWLHNSPDYSPNTQKMMEMDGVAFNLVTPAEYLRTLKRAGFIEIEMENISSEHAFFSQENIATIERLSDQIEARFGSDVYAYCIESWSYQRDAFQSQDIITAIFKAKKQ